MQQGQGPDVASLVKDLTDQARDSNSKLCKGAVTRHIESITVQSQDVGAENTLVAACQSGLGKTDGAKTCPIDVLQFEVYSISGLPPSVTPYLCFSVLGGPKDVMSEQSLESLLKRGHERSRKVPPLHTTHGNAKMESLRQVFEIREVYDGEKIAGWLDDDDESKSCPTVMLDGHKVSVLVTLHDRNITPHEDDATVLGVLHIHAFRFNHTVDQYFHVDTSCGISRQNSSAASPANYGPAEAQGPPKPRIHMKIRYCGAASVQSVDTNLVEAASAAAGLSVEAKRDQLDDSDFEYSDFEGCGEARSSGTPTTSPKLQVSILSLDNLPQYQYGVQRTPSISFAVVELDAETRIDLPLRYALRLTSKNGETNQSSQGYSHLECPENITYHYMDPMASSSVAKSANVTWNEEFHVFDAYSEREVIKVLEGGIKAESLTAHRMKGNDIMILFVLHALDEAGLQAYEAQCFVHRMHTAQVIDKEIPLRHFNGHKVVGSDGKYAILHVNLVFDETSKLSDTSNLSFNSPRIPLGKSNDAGEELPKMCGFDEDHLPSHDDTISNENLEIPKDADEALPLPEKSDVPPSSKMATPLSHISLQRVRILEQSCPRQQNPRLRHRQRCQLSKA